MKKVVISPHFETCEAKGNSKVKRRRRRRGGTAYAPFRKTWLISYIMCSEFTYNVQVKKKKKDTGKAPFLKSWLRQKEQELRQAQLYNKAGADEGERGAVSAGVEMSTPVPTCNTLDIVQEINIPVPIAGRHLALDLGLKIKAPSNLGSEISTPLNLGLEISNPVPIASQPVTSFQALYSQMLHFVAGPVKVTSSRYQPSPVHGGLSGGGGGGARSAVGGGRENWPSTSSFCSTPQVFMSRSSDLS